MMSTVISSKMTEIFTLPSLGQATYKDGMTESSLPVALKKHRASRKLTLDALASASGVSRAMISKIERGEATPTTSVLGKLAEALDVTISQLVGGKMTSGCLLIPASKQPVYREDVSGFERRSLSPLYRGRGVDVALNILPAGETTGPFPSHREGVEEHLFLREGALQVQVGDDTYNLEAGDFLFYPADRDHTFRNPGRQSAEFIIVIDSTRLR